MCRICLSLQYRYVPYIISISIHDWLIIDDFVSVSYPLLLSFAFDNINFKYSSIINANLFHFIPCTNICGGILNVFIRRFKFDSIPKLISYVKCLYKVLLLYFVFILAVPARFAEPLLPSMCLNSFFETANFSLILNII